MDAIWKTLPNDLANKIALENIEYRIETKQARRLVASTTFLEFAQKFDTIPKVRCDENGGWFDEAVWVVLPINSNGLYMLDHNRGMTCFQYVSERANPIEYNKGDRWYPKTTDHTDPWLGDDIPAILDDFETSMTFDDGREKRRALNLPRGTNISRYMYELDLLGLDIL